MYIYYRYTYIYVYEYLHVLMMYIYKCICTRIYEVHLGIAHHMGGNTKGAVTTGYHSISFLQHPPIKVPERERESVCVCSRQGQRTREKMSV